MAIIAKICELTGKYPGWLMYKHKKNSIQVMPEERCKFEHANYELLVEPPTALYNYKKMEYSFEYNYCLHVFDKKLQGNVHGEYYNYTKRLEHMYFNLWRMLGYKDLKITILNCPIDKYLSTPKTDKWICVDDYIIYNKEE